MEDEEAKLAKEIVLVECDTTFIDKTYIVEGYDFNKGINYSEILKSYMQMGIQGTHLSRGINIINKMLISKDPDGKKCTIYLGFCSGIITSGMRDIIRFLCEMKLVDVIVTTGGGVEEDLMKCLEDHVVGSFGQDDESLLEHQVVRQGNVFIPKKNFDRFEEFFNRALDEMVLRGRDGYSWTPKKIVDLLGERINDTNSFCYWAWKNKIPVYAPAITDGAMGDILYRRYKKKLPTPKIDVIEDIRNLNGFTMKLKKTGCIILGGGVIKHHIFNANLMRNGADFCVIINTAQEYDASDSGAKPTEALSWGKIRLDGEYVKIYSEVSLVLPLLVAESFYQYYEKNGKRD